MTKKIVVAGIFIDTEKRILLTRRKKNRLYCNPSGKVDKGETLQQALCREISEEAGISTKPGDLRLLAFLDLAEVLIFFYHVTCWQGAPRNLEPDKHEDWQWHKELPEDHKLESSMVFFKSRLFTEFGLKQKNFSEGIYEM